MLIIAIIIAALTPLITKKLTKLSIAKNRLTTKCQPYFPDGFCAFCYTTPKSCVVCTKDCLEGQYKDVENCECKECSIMHNDAKCTKCNLENCLQCEDGYYLDSNNKCVICPIGYYCYIDNEGKSQKVPCPKGKYNDIEGQKECKLCNKSTSTQTGSVAISTAMTQCTNCTDGKYAKQEGQETICEDCVKGYYCPQGKLIPCPQGYANNSLGQSVCTACAKSDTDIQGSVAQNTAMTECTKCESKYYSANAAQSLSCNICPSGYYCIDGKIAPCPKGSANANQGQTTCVQCKKSTSTTQGSVATSTAMTSCTFCSPGYYAEKDGQGTQCTKCPIGYSCPQGMLKQCQSGQTSAQGAASCIDCSQGCTACSQTADNCSSCKADYYLQGTSCLPCSVGYYSNAGATKCLSCSQMNANCTQCTSNSCTKCESGYYSKANSKTCTSCSVFHEKCTSCTQDGCMGCAQGYEVNGTSCKLSFNCEEEGGVAYDNICAKSFNSCTTANACLSSSSCSIVVKNQRDQAIWDFCTPANLNVSSNHTWRAPSYSEMTLIAQKNGTSFKNVNALTITSKVSGIGITTCTTKGKCSMTYTTSISTTNCKYFCVTNINN